jgi:23S rRNA (cytidine1920-2'-O)/16S rRNA (cytidine1409-2'-O)-methyltransferase
MRIRLDKLLAERGNVASRQIAQALILAGRVLVNEQKIEKPGTPVDEDAQIRILGEQPRYVSRGGQKLEAALDHWGIQLEGRICADVGASTGGFTDCMLQHGASRVLAIDTGYGQIADKLRNDARVELWERTNARYLEANSLEPGITFAAVDVAFISATLVLEPLVRAVGETSAGKPLELVVLIKPQFEAGREFIGKGGIVRDPRAHRSSIERVVNTVQSLGGSNLEVMDSPILGAEGNREFLLHGVLTRAIAPE